MSSLTHAIRTARVGLLHGSNPHALLIRLSPSCGTRLLTANAHAADERHDALKPRSPPRFVRRSLQVVKYTSYIAVSAIFGVFALGTGIFIHDAFTYTDRHIDRVPVFPLALHPERGGPKGLPIVNTLLGDAEDDEARKLSEKPKLVIVGGGWGVGSGMKTADLADINFHQSVATLQSLVPGEYHVTIVSPDTFTTFTPLLPCKHPL